jgi:hypothetical protein
VVCTFPNARGWVDREGDAAVPVRRVPHAECVIWKGGQ